MIILNEDKALKSRFVWGKVKPYKGQMSNTLIVVEDVIDKSKKNPDNHRCICKCLACGRVYPGTVAVRRVREKSIECPCQGKWETIHKFANKKGVMLRFLNKELNIAKNEAVFEEDMERIYYLKMIIRFLESRTLRNYFRDHLDMVY